MENGLNNAWSSTKNSKNHSPQHFDQTYLALDQDKVILRKDRLEFSSSGAQEDMFFLIFQGSTSTMVPKATTVNSTSTKAVANPAMARVLGAETMQVKDIAGAIYEELYPGVDLEVSAKDGQLQLTFTADKVGQLEQILLKVWGAQHQQGDKESFYLQGKAAGFDVLAAEGDFYLEDTDTYFLDADQRTRVTLYINRK